MRFLSARNIRSYTQKFSPTGLPKCELKNDNINRHANADGGGLGPSAIGQRTQEASTLHKELETAKKS